MTAPSDHPGTRDFFDPDKLRAAVLDSAKSAFESRLNRIETPTTKLQVTNLRYQDKTFSKQDAKQAILEKRDLTVPLKATVSLIDKSDGSVIDQKDTIISHVPYVTERNTSILNGSQYIVMNQQRLKPGVFTRIKDSGEAEAHVNVLPGSGVSGRIIFYPDRSLFIYEIQNTQIKLYGILRDVFHVQDKEIEAAWGKSIFELNRAQYSGQEVEKLYSKVFKRS